MAYLIPESVTHLQAKAFVSDAELNKIGRSEIIREAAEKMAEQALRKLISDCISTQDYMGYQGQTLSLDVYVLSPDDLHAIIAEARKQGERDAMMWSPTKGGAE